MSLRSARTLRVFGLLAFLLAGLSIVDMFRPRPSDGVVLEADALGQLVTRKVAPGSGADRAGIRPGDRILGIDRTVLRSTAHADELLNRHEIGATISYLLRRPDGLAEVDVELGRRFLGDLPYLFACLLGFGFFFIGLFVLGRQPNMRAAQIFFLLCNLFFLFLVCRLRPASYSWVDSFALTTGMMALLFLPASFLHFFLVFPQPAPLRPRAGDPAYDRRRRAWLAILWAVYLLPPLVLALGLAASRLRESPLPLISGAPRANWWVLAVYMLLGVTALAFNARRLRDPRQRRGAALVLIGAVFGLLPFLILAVAFPSFLQTEKFLFYGVAPLVLVPLTFALAIIRFQLLDIRVILQKSLLYTATTAVVTALYAVGIALFDAFSRDTPMATSRFFPIVFALVIVLLFEPLRRRLQIFVDRFFFAEHRRLRAAMRDLGQAFAARVDLEAVVKDLVEKLPRLLDLRFAALYLRRGEGLERAAGPPGLPDALEVPGELRERLGERRGLARIEELAQTAAWSPAAADLLRQLDAAGVEAIGNLSSPRRHVGLVLVSGKAGQLGFDREELELLDGLLHQAAIGLETSMLVEERTRQVELERDLEIAASVQSSLLPASLGFAPGWKVAALCRPARHVGGDFYTALPGPHDGTFAIVYGDVAGKSISGAMVMMAAHEVLHSLAMIHRDPEELLALANQRLYRLGPRKNFVAMAYLSPGAGGSLDYILAGQPQPLIRGLDGGVRELPLPDHRLPLGAVAQGGHRLCHVDVEPGEIVLGYSDGVVEARSPEGDLFGVDRLTEVVVGTNGDPGALVGSVARALHDFTQGADPYDDVTLVAVACDREVG